MVASACCDDTATRMRPPSKPGIAMARQRGPPSDRADREDATGAGGALGQRG